MRHLHFSFYQKYATGISACVIAVSKSQEFFVESLSTLFFLTTTQGIRLRQRVDVFSTTSDTTAVCTCLYVVFYCLLRCFLCFLYSVSCTYSVRLIPARVTGPIKIILKFYWIKPSNQCFPRSAQIRRLDAKRYCYLSHAICYSYGADNKSYTRTVVREFCKDDDQNQ